jgi:hypothetical protein
LLAPNWNWRNRRISQGRFSPMTLKLKTSFRRLLVAALASTISCGLLATASSAAGTASVGVSAPAQPVAHGQQFTVSLNVQTNGATIIGGQASLTFNPSLLSVSSVAEGTLLKQGGASTYFIPGVIDNQQGTVTGICDVILGTSQGVSGSGSLALITFTAGQSDGISPLNLSQVILADQSGNTSPFSLANSQVSVSQPAPSPTPTPTPTPSPSPSPNPPPAPIGGGFGGGGGSFVPSGPDTSLSPIAQSTNSVGIFIKPYSQDSSDGAGSIQIAVGTAAKTDSGKPFDNLSFEPAAEVQPAMTQPAGRLVLGQVYALGPEGSTFDPPISLSLTYDPSSLPNGANEDSLRLAYWDQQSLKWQDLDGSAVDPAKHLVTAPLSHFSDYAILADLPSPANISLSGLNIPSATVAIGESFSVRVTAQNSGDSAGSLSLNLDVDGVLAQSREINLAGRAEATYEFTLILNSAGTHALQLAGLSGMVQVAEPINPLLAAPASPEPTAADLPVSTPAAVASAPSVELPAILPAAALGINPVDLTDSAIAPPVPAAQPKTFKLSIFGVVLSVSCFLAFASCSFILYRRRQLLKDL